MISEFLESLNQKQKSAVEQPLQPVLVLAGPGTGKTRLLVARIGWMIFNKAVSPEKILALTFTNKAAREMKSRLIDLCGEQGKEVWAGTIHSFALELIRKYYKRLGLKKHFAVCDEVYQQKLVKSILTPYTTQEIDNKVKGILLSFSNHLVKGKPLPEFAKERFKTYQQLLLDRGLVDFDQIIVFCLKLLRENQDIVDEYRHLFPNILVDEFQDTDALQYQIIKLLAERSRNIFVVADDDQSIYSWRGANPENITEFIKDFNVAGPILLDINYRSGRKIIDTAQAIISGTDRIEPQKEMIEAAERDNDVKICFFMNESDEIKFILNQIAEWHEAGILYRDMAILYPYHKIGAELEQFFLRKRIPYQMADRNCLLNSPVLSRIIQYLKVINTPEDDILLEELGDAELGMVLSGLIKANGQRNQVGYRKSLYEYYRESRKDINFDQQMQIKSFVSKIGSIVNLRNFYSLSKLIEEIYFFIDVQQKSFMKERQELLEPPPEPARLNWPEKNPATVNVYHRDEKIAFLGAELVSSVLQISSRPVSEVKEIAGDLTIILSDAEIETAAYKYIDLTGIANDKRQSALGNLIKFIQGVIAKKSEQVLNNYIILDLETTDSDPATCGIVEIAAVKVENGKIAAEYQTLVKPEVRISPKAQQVHQITPQMVHNQRSISQVWPELKSFIGDSLIIAHNGYSFDFPILDRFSRQIEGQKLRNTRLDTLPLARMLYPNQKNSVDALMERYGLKAGQRHRALDDVVVLKDIFDRLMQQKQNLLSRSSLSLYTDIVALANFIEKKYIQTEDRIFFLDGYKKLLSPWSKILEKTCQKFGLNQTEIKTEIYDAVKKINPQAGEFSAEERLLDKIKILSTQYDHIDINTAIAEFLSYLSLNQGQDELENVNAVSLLTYYAAKGLEFDKVILVGLEEKNMPGFHALKEDPEDDRPVSKKIEEQRRLFYVGLTRGKSEVILTAVKNRGGWERESSQFLKNLDISKIII